MKYLIASDFHLNEANRFDDFISSLFQIQLVADKIKPDAYIIAGDIFDNRRPTPRELKAFSSHLRMIKAKKYIIAGNHDRIDKNLSTLDWLGNIDDNIEIEDGKYKILITHENIKEALIGNDNIKLNNYKSYKDYKGYDVIIFGHIHKPQIINEKNPLAFYPGSIERVDFAERNDNKYIWILDINDKLKLRRHKLKVRDMVYIKINLDTKEKDINKKDFKIEESIVKVDILGTKDKIKSLNYDKLLSKFKDAYQIDINFFITDVEGIKNKATTSDKSILEFFDSYSEKKKLNDNINKLCRKLLKDEYHRD
jgi:putative phosphoesterase